MERWIFLFLSILLLGCTSVDNCVDLNCVKLNNSLDNPAPMTVLFEEGGGGFHGVVGPGEQRIIIDDEKKWAELLELIQKDRNANSEKIAKLKKTVDFSRERVIGVFMGDKSTMGCGIRIEKAFTNPPNGVLVHVKRTYPQNAIGISATVDSDFCGFAEALSSPYTFVKIPRGKPDERVEWVITPQLRQRTSENR